MRRYKFSIPLAVGVLVAIILMAGCKVESISPYSTTNPPRIYGMDMIPDDSIEVQDTLLIRCNADDGDNGWDTLIYNWFDPSNGLMDTAGFRYSRLTGTDSRVRWVADTVIGAFPIQVTVADLWHSSIFTDTIYVMPEGAYNIPPVIERITTDADSVEPFDTLRVSCDAVDTDTLAVLEYFWSADHGRFLSDDTRLTQWIAPSVTGRYYLTVSVADQYDSVSDSVAVVVAPPGTFNHAPIIRSLTAVPEEIAMGGVTQLTCVAEDHDSDPLQYFWSAPYGLIGGEGSQIRWTAPEETGDYTIHVAVSDGALSVSETVIVSVNLVYYSDFSTDQVTGRWQYMGLLAEFGDADGFHSFVWDEENEAMSVIGRSTYGSHGFQLAGENFGNGRFTIDVQATSTRFGNIGFLPKFIDARNYFLIGLDYNVGFYQVYICINGTRRWLANGYTILSPNRYYTISYNQSIDGDVVVALDGTHLWGGSVEEPFDNAVPLGVVVYGMEDSGPVLFDNLTVSAPQ